MHVKLLFAMIALAIIPIIFLQSFYINYMMNHIRANRVDLVRNYGAQIAEEMLQTDYLEGGDSDVIDGEIRQFSGLYDGRIIVTNADFDVRMDTYGMLSGKKLVSEAVVQALQNNEQSYYWTDLPRFDRVCCVHNYSCCSPDYSFKTTIVFLLV